MRHHSLAGGTVLVFALALTACKGPYSAEGVCESLARAQCEFEYRCCNAVERRTYGYNTGGFSSTLHNTEAECFDELRKAFCAQMAVYADGQRAGRLAWDDVAAQECLEPRVQAARDCNAEKYLAPEPDEDCLGFAWVEGQVDEGDRCFLDEECADDEARCAQPPPEDPDEPQVISVAGECTLPPGVGDDCSSEPCRDGLYCDYDADEPVCAVLFDVGEMCDYGGQCRSGICDVDNLCAAPLANGEACADHNQCLSGFCDFYDTLQCADKRALGEDCLSDFECASGFCDGSECAFGDDGPDVDYEVCRGPEEG
jgi:hypothetical protein